MSKQFEPRKFAGGSARRSFKGGVWRQEVDPETGATRSVQVPRSHWEQPDDAIPLTELPEFWEHNNTQFTDERVAALNDRLCHDYLEIVCTYDYMVSGDPEDFKRLVDEKEAFFDAVAEIDGWPYWKYTKQNSWRENRNLVTGKFFEYCPEYESYREYRAAGRDKSSTAYGQWRRDCMYNYKHMPALPGTGTGFRYRDEELQLGEIEMQAHMDGSDFEQISIYQYLDNKALVPTPGMPDLAIIRHEIVEQAGVDVEPDEFVRIVAEHAARQADIQAAPDAAPAGPKPRTKTRRELEMEDLDRLVAGLRQAGEHTTERSVDSYGW